MTVGDFFFYFSMLVGTLAGVAGGVHTAVLVAAGNDADAPDKSDNHDTYKASEITRSTSRKAVRARRTRFFKGGKKTAAHLETRAAARQGPSFAEYECQFTGEDESEMLRRRMAEQDQSYAFIHTMMQQSQDTK